VGTNIAFSRDDLEKIGRFNEDLGRRGKKLISGEEANMIQRFLAEGKKVYYEPNAFVFHIVPPQRRTVRFLIRRVFTDGATQPLLDFNKEKFKKVFFLRRILYDLPYSLLCFLKCLAFLMINAHKSFCYFLGSVQKFGRVTTELKFLF
jgi:hypothetical protein